MIALIQLLYSLWPCLFLLVLIPQASFRSRVILYLSGWVLWAVFGMALLFSARPPLGLINEPVNSLLFAASGLLAAAILAAPPLLRRLREQHALKNAQRIDDLRRLSPEQFEALVAAYFNQYGHRALQTGRSGDHGIDLVVQSRQGEKWIVQCKRWRGSAGEPLVRELFGAMHHAGAQRAFLMTTGTITPQARLWAKDKPLSLYDGESLVRLFRRLHKKRTLKH